MDYILPLPALLILALPWHAMLRFVFVAGLLVLTYTMLAPPVLAEDRHFDWLGVIILIPFAAAALIALLLQLTLRALFSERGTAFERMGDWHPHFRIYRAFDIGIACIGGPLIGLFAVIRLGWLFAGTEFAVLAHATVLALAATAGWLGSRLRRHAAPAPGACTLLAAGASLLVLTGYSWFHPAFVLRSAVAIAAGDPYCIALTTRWGAADQLSDLTFLTMDKSTRGHHAFLVVQTKDGVSHAHWSYRKRAFEGVQTHRGDANGIPATLCNPAEGSQLS